MIPRKSPFLSRTVASNWIKDKIAKKLFAIWSRSKEKFLGWKPIKVFCWKELKTMSQKWGNWRQPQNETLAISLWAKSLQLISRTPAATMEHRWNKKHTSETPKKCGKRNGGDLFGQHSWLSSYCISIAFYIRPTVICWSIVALLGKSILPSATPDISSEKIFRPKLRKYFSGENWSKRWFPLRIIRRWVIFIGTQKVDFHAE